MPLKFSERMITLSFKVQVEEVKSALPIEILGMQFKIPVDDEAIERYERDHLALLQEIETVTEGTQIGAAREIMKKSYDFLLGDGAFEKIYKKCPSTLALVEPYLQIHNHFVEEIGKLNKGLSQSELAKQYVKNKKKK